MIMVDCVCHQMALTSRHANVQSGWLMTFNPYLKRSNNIARTATNDKSNDICAQSTNLRLAWQN